MLYAVFAHLDPTDIHRSPFTQLGCGSTGPIFHGMGMVPLSIYHPLKATMAMTTAELETLVTALYDSNMRQAGIIEAHRAVFDSLFRVVAWSLPELPAMIGATLDMLQDEAREGLEPDSVKAFDNTVAAFQEELRRPCL